MFLLPAGKEMPGKIENRILTSADIVLCRDGLAQVFFHTPCFKLREEEEFEFITIIFIKLRALNDLDFLNKRCRACRQFLIVREQD